MEKKMLELSAPILNSHIWKNAFEIRDDLKHDRERLKQSFIQFRERAAQLATEIRSDLPELTIHDITHLDALWETAAQITGPEYALTPTETYILGGAILLHDLSMSIAATPGGLEELKGTQRWKDLVFSKYKNFEQRTPTEKELKEPSLEIYKSTIFDILRRIHAESAEKLAFTSFSHKGNQLFLIEDSELRLAFGRIIGEIAHSHWWNISEIEKKFKETVGTPPWASATNWHINPLKIACILRAADAAHLDARRAPIFVRSFSRLNPISAQHWDFQEKLLKPYLKEDALIFTSGQSFPFSEASSWWVCVDTLKMVDTELRGIDALLSDNNEMRFAARRVAGIDHPERLAKYIRTEGWSPVNATIQISNMPSIIRSIGGEELYGVVPTVPVRELIQNSADAIRARRVYEGLSDDFGEVEIELSKEEDSYWLKITDNGTGMSETVLTNYLLDFGKSFWTSNYIQEEFPGLASSDFEATGKYGIGFFSVFMISEKVKVVTRHVDAAKKDTIVLEFGSGLLERPTIRPAFSHEYSREGGTSITLKLLKDPYEELGILHNRRGPIKLSAMCSALTPTIDVKITAKENGLREIVSDANDWTAISSARVIERLSDNMQALAWRYGDHTLDTKVSENLRIIYDDHLKIVGRACITTSTDEHSHICGNLTVGGLACNFLVHITGFLLGRTLRASRDISEPLAPLHKLAEWATEQASLVRRIYSDHDDLCRCAQTISLCGGDTLDLPVAQLNGKWLSFDEIKSLTPRKRIFITADYNLKLSLKNIKNPKFTEEILIFDRHEFSRIISGMNNYVFRENDYFEPNLLRFSKKLVFSIAESWNTDPDELCLDFFEADTEQHKIAEGNGEDVLCDGFYLTNSKL